MKISKIVGFNLWMATSFLVVFFLFKNMGAVATTGTWGGIPDIGFTEWLTGGSGGSTFNNPNRATGLTNYTQDQAFTVPQVGQPVSVNPNQAVQSGGAVLGASTQNTGGGNTITQQQMSSNYSFGDPNNPDLSNPVKQSDYENYKRSQTSGPSGPSAQDLYNQRMNGLIDQNYNDLSAYLPQSMAAQQSQAQGYTDQQLSDLGFQTDQNKADLNTQIGKVEQGQVKTLRDVADNVRNLIFATNNKIGAMGGGDSSAQKMASYAITKMGNQNYGNVKSQTTNAINDINTQISKIDAIKTQETSRIKSELTQKMGEISQWFADQQIAIKGARNQDQQALATNMYNQAVSALTNLQNKAQERMSQIESWALSSSTTAKEALAKANEYSQYQAQQQTFDPITGLTSNPTAINGGIQYGGYGGTDEYLKKLLG